MKKLSWRAAHTQKGLKTKQRKTQKHYTLMERVDQGNKGICEAIQGLITQIAGLSQAPRSCSQELSEWPNRRFDHHLEQHPPDDVSSVKCPTMRENVAIAANVAVQNTGQQAVERKQQQPL